MELSRISEVSNTPGVLSMGRVITSRNSKSLRSVAVSVLQPSPNGNRQQRRAYKKMVSNHG